jgi:hypothetical protein
MDVVERAHGVPADHEPVDRRPVGCAGCRHCYCRNGLRRAHRHRAALVTLLALAGLVFAGRGALQASWDTFDRNADVTLCRLAGDRC